MYDVCALVPKLCPTLGHFMIVARQAPIPMEFSRQEYWSGLPFPSPGDLPKPGIKPGSPAFQANALSSETPGKPLNLTQMTIISTTVGKNPLEEME